MAMLLVFEIASCKLNNHESSTSDKIACYCFKSHISYWKIGSAELASGMSYSVKNRMMDKVHKNKIVSLHSAVFFILWLWY